MSAGVWKKTLQYLGLVEDEEYQELDEVVEQPPARPEQAPVHRLPRPQAAPATMVDPVVETSATVRTIPQTRAPAASIHRAEPKRFNEARELGERFKQGIPVIMNLQSTEDATARRLVDFASGLVFAMDGKIEMVANRVYLVTPENLEVSAEEREKIRGGGFYNQF